MSQTSTSTHHSLTHLEQLLVLEAPFMANAPYGVPPTVQYVHAVQAEAGEHQALPPGPRVQWTTCLGMCESLCTVMKLPNGTFLPV